MTFADDMRRYCEVLPRHLSGRIEPPQSTWLPWRGRNIHIARGGDPDAPVRGILVRGRLHQDVHRLPGASLPWPPAYVCDAIRFSATLQP
jgi:hypothetical protein